MVNSKTESTSTPVVDFSNTEIAFSHKSNGELRRTAWLFRLMNKQWLVNAGSNVGLWLNHTGINMFNPLIRATIFRQFCGGTSLENAVEAIGHLWDRKTGSVLDYGAEAKTKEEDFDATLQENIRAINFASMHEGIPVISSKVTALAADEILEKYQSGNPLTSEEQKAYDRIEKRIDTLCRTAWEKGIIVFIDAEETWLQDTIDALCKKMMARYNRERVVVYHTYQLYRKDKLQSLKDDYAEAKSNGYILGAKLVRGAYMEKERRRAVEMGYPSPIQDTREDTDRDYDDAVRFCVEHYQDMASCNASHNLKSNLLQAELIAQKGLPRNHPNLNFCQLYGMSDYITFNLAEAGYNVAKYVVYGAVKEVVPYLIRRAKENTSVTGEMSRELSLITAEIRRRGLK
ncbi:MAG TPA: proline dehydrogenase family protein [Saprospiraceae bacterium]|nr:proline dehydrogenase family protein [Saprospiraceae bacterium]